MEFKPDWDEARERFVTWWNGSHHERVTLAVMAPRRVDLPPFELPAELRTRWLDPEVRIAEAERQFRSTHYLGEAFPYFDTHLGPGSLALYLGCPGILHETTVWYGPIATAPDEVPPLEFDPDDVWWQASRRLAEEGAKRGEGRYLTSVPDLIENLDTVVSFLGVRETMLALKDDPEGVRRLIEEVNQLYFAYYDELYDLVAGPRLGSCFSAFQIWGPGKTAKLQCDASAMISPEAFAEFVAPALVEQASRLDFAAYHLDGPGAVCHVEQLVRIPDLNAIQWTPGAGEPGPGSEVWWPMYRRIRDAGKGLLLLGVSFAEVEPLARHLGPDGVYIATQAPSLEAGRDLLERACAW